MCIMKEYNKGIGREDAETIIYKKILLFKVNKKCWGGCAC